MCPISSSTEDIYCHGTKFSVMNVQFLLAMYNAIEAKDLQETSMPVRRIHPKADQGHDLVDRASTEDIYCHGTKFSVMNVQFLLAMYNAIEAKDLQETRYGGSRGNR
ncbi:hypothetical protein ScPMuIL_001851 [Solemya velum]